MNISIKQMRAFSELAREKSFTRAADRCHISQPALSALIKGIEETTGTRLFNRNTRNVELTPDGIFLESMITALLGSYDRLVTEFQDVVQKNRGSVTVGALASIAGGALPPVIDAFQRRYPGIELAIKDVTSDICLELVRSKQVDFALTASVSLGNDLSSAFLASDSFHLVCRSDHPLSRHARLAVSQIRDLPIIQFARSSSVRQHLDAAFYPDRLPVSIEVNNLVTAAGLIAHGLGITIVPGMTLFQFRIPSLVAIPITLPIHERKICVITRRNSTLSVSANAFVEMLRAHWAPESS